MFKTILVCAVLATLLLNGCYYDNEEELYPSNFCDTLNVTYANTVRPIIQARCATPGCHVAGGDGTGDFIVFGEFAEQVANGRVLRSITRDPAGIPMPPSAALPPCELRQIQLWIEAGANNN